MRGEKKRLKNQNYPFDDRFSWLWWCDSLIAFGAANAIPLQSRRMLSRANKTLIICFVLRFDLISEFPIEMIVFFDFFVVFIAPVRLKFFFFNLVSLRFLLFPVYFLSIQFFSHSFNFTLMFIMSEKNKKKLQIILVSHNNTVSVESASSFQESFYLFLNFRPSKRFTIVHLCRNFTH